MVEGSINDHTIQGELREKFNREQYLPNDLGYIEKSLSLAGRKLWERYTAAADKDHGNWLAIPGSPLKRTADETVDNFNKVD